MKFWILKQTLVMIFLAFKLRTLYTTYFFNFFRRFSFLK